MNQHTRDYFDAVPDSRKPGMHALHAMIVEAFPEALVDMQYKMPTYHIKDGWVAIANQKNYISLYTCGYHHIRSFKDKHPGIKTGKGCINFRDKDILPLHDLRAVVRHAILHPKDD